MKASIGKSKIKKYQSGGSLSMIDLKKKYPSVDTTRKGDVRGSEINARAPKKVIDKYNDTYNAFDKKFKGKPSYKNGGSVSAKKK